MVPDRVIVRKIKEINRDLFVRWNAEKCWFELWDKPFAKPAYKVTSITQSIYDSNLPREFCPLDERILWWIQGADLIRQGGSKKVVKEWDSRVKAFEKKVNKTWREDCRHAAAEMWNIGNYGFVTKGPKKNDKYPKFNNYEKQTWVRPDSQNKVKPRIWGRSRANALKYNYKVRG